MNCYPNISKGSKALRNFISKHWLLSLNQHYHIGQLLSWIAQNREVKRTSSYKIADWWIIFQLLFVPQNGMCSDGSISISIRGIYKTVHFSTYIFLFVCLFVYISHLIFYKWIGLKSLHLSCNTLIIINKCLLYCVAKMWESRSALGKNGNQQRCNILNK